MWLGNNLAAITRRTLQCLLDPLVALLPGAAGLVQRCGICRDSPRYVNPERLARGLVIVLPGIEGPSLYTAGFRAGLGELGDLSGCAENPGTTQLECGTAASAVDRPAPGPISPASGGRITAEGGCATCFRVNLRCSISRSDNPVGPGSQGSPAVIVYNWAGFWPGMFAAFSRSHRHRRVEILVEKIRSYRRAYPGRPVVLIGHSAGAAIAIHTAETLGPAEPLTGVVAAATPLHRDYDLSAALAGVRRGLVTCHSRLDFQLQVLVAIGGNFDRRWGPTAGRTGFAFREGRQPGEPAGNGKFTQIAWDRSMIPFGHLGGHVGWGSAAWTRRYLAPIIADWNNGRG